MRGGAAPRARGSPYPRPGRPRRAGLAGKGQRGNPPARLDVSAARNLQRLESSERGARTSGARHGGPEAGSGPTRPSGAEDSNETPEWTSNLIGDATASTSL